jgi:hypothetical protein
MIGMPPGDNLPCASTYKVVDDGGLEDGCAADRKMTAELAGCERMQKHGCPPRER